MNLIALVRLMILGQSKTKAIPVTIDINLIKRRVKTKNFLSAFDVEEVMNSKVLKR